MAKLEIDQKALERVCRKYHIGDHVPGLAFFEIEEELSNLIGRQVDLNTPQFLSRYFRDRVLAQARVEYDAA